MAEFHYEVTCRHRIDEQEKLYRIHQKLEKYGKAVPVQGEDRDYRRVLSIKLNEKSSPVDVERFIRDAGLEVRVADHDEFR